MKVAQNDETNPDTQPIRPPHIPSIENTQLSPSDSSIRKCETPGILSRMFPLSPVSLVPALGHPWHNVLPRITLCTLIALLFIVFPLCYFFPVDSETIADVRVFDYIEDDPSFSADLPTKPPP